MNEKLSNITTFYFNKGAARVDGLSKVRIDCGKEKTDLSIDCSSMKGSKSVSLVYVSYK